MAKTIAKLLTKNELLAKEHATIVEQQLMLIPDDQLPKQKKQTILNQLYNLVQPDKVTGWGFSMISNQKAEMILDAIFNLPPEKRPNQVLKTFHVICTKLRHDTGEIMLTRHQIAEKIRSYPNDVSSAMKTLEEMGVVRRKRDPVEGMQGRGVVTYFMNPDVAWHGSLDKREQESKRTKEQFQYKLKLIEGGLAAV